MRSPIRAGSSTSLTGSGSATLKFQGVLSAFHWMEVLSGKSIFPMKVLSGKSIIWVKVSFPDTSNYTKTAERKILSAVGTVAGDPAQTQSKSQTRSKTRRLHRNQNQHQPPIPHLSCSPDIFCFPNWTLISPPLKNCHTFPARLHEPETFHL